MSDLSFSKHGKWVHCLRLNEEGDATAHAFVHEFVPHFMKPYLHTLVVRGQDGLEQRVAVSASYSEEGTLVRVEGIHVRAGEEVCLVMEVKKRLLHFEAYPNDPNRGLDVPQMPIMYDICAEGGSDCVRKSTFSRAMLVQIPQPDFSMPFNVNAITSSLIGFIFINFFV